MMPPTIKRPNQPAGFHRSRPGRRMLSLVLWLLIAVLTAAGATAERTFLWNEANALMVSADSLEDYRQAARAYQQLALTGGGNGVLFYNLGTALLRAERYPEAFDALARAERYLGRQPDIRQNMKISLARLQQVQNGDWPWPRIVFFWHFDLAAATRTAIALAAWTLFWLALAWRQLGMRRGLNALLFIMLLTLMAFGSSAISSGYQELTAKPYVLDAQPAAGP